MVFKEIGIFISSQCSLIVFWLLPAPPLNNCVRPNILLLFLGEVAQVQIKAKTYFGSRHGLETLSQLISYDEIRQKLQMHKSASITDKPAYVHRGLLIDTSRNFFRYFL